MAIDDQISGTLQVLSALLVFLFAYVSYAVEKYRALTIDPDDPPTLWESRQPCQRCRNLLIYALVPAALVLGLLTPRLVDVLTHWSWSNSVRTGFFLVFAFVVALFAAIVVMIVRIGGDLAVITETIGRPPARRPRRARPEDRPPT